MIQNCNFLKIIGTKFATLKTYRRRPWILRSTKFCKLTLNEKELARSHFGARCLLQKSYEKSLRPAELVDNCSPLTLLHVSNSPFHILIYIGRIMNMLNVEGLEIAKGSRSNTVDVYLKSKRILSQSICRCVLSFSKRVKPLFGSHEKLKKLDRTKSIATSIGF
jgi:hypothetical protein